CEAAVIPDHSQGRRRAVFQVLGDTLSCIAQGLVGEVVPDNASPAVRAELDRGGHFPELKVLSLTGASEDLDHLLDVLRSRLRADEEGVFGVHDHQVADADDGNQLVWHGDETVACIDQNGHALNDITGLVLAKQVGELAPGAHVRPLEVGGDQQQTVGLFEDGGIHGVDRGPGGGLGRPRLVTRSAPGERGDKALVVDRPMPLELLREDVTSPAEEVEVPEMAAVFYVAPGGGRVRLFDEADYLTGRLACDRGLGAGLDVAERGARVARSQPDRHKLPGAGGDQARAADSLLEGG